MLQDRKTFSKRRAETCDIRVFEKQKFRRSRKILRMWLGGGGGWGWWCWCWCCSTIRHDVIRQRGCENIGPSRPFFRVRWGAILVFTRTRVVIDISNNYLTNVSSAYTFFPLSDRYLVPTPSFTFAG